MILFTFGVVYFLLFSGRIINGDHFVDPSLLNVPEIKRLESEISKSYLLKHNFLKCFENGDFANMTEAASIFALNHYVYSKNFINYLQTVAAKIDNKEISKPILENIHEELGNYEQDDIDTLSKMGIHEDWYNKIPHKYLSQRFFQSLGIDAETIPVIDMEDDDIYEPIEQDQSDRNFENPDLYTPADCAIYVKPEKPLFNPDDTQQLSKAKLFNPENNDTPGETFTKYMIHLYRTTNACESLAIIGFAIEETVSRLYEYIWNGLQNHTPLTDDKIVFFPLHILIDDGHADLLKLGFKHYLVNNNTMCQESENIINDVLEKRIKMYDDIRRIIEEKQGYQCKLPYGSGVDYEREQEQNEIKISMKVDVDGAVKDAERQTLQYNVLGNQNWNIQDKMALSARILGRQGHGETLSGQITCRRYNVRMVEEKHAMSMLVNPYGKPLELVTNKDFIEIDGDLNVLSGTGFPNKATRFHFHVYAKRPDIKCIIHTHPPFASALSMIGEKLFISHMDTMAFYEDVQYLDEWPGIPFGDEEGDIISGILSDKYWSALLSHHGLIVGGRSIEEATYRAYFFERAAKMQLDALAAVGGDVERLKKTNPDLSRKARDWRIHQGPVNAHFNGWAQIVLKEDSPFI